MSQRQALVTGAGRGVGQGVALALAAAGYAVAVNDLHPERADETVELVRKDGGVAGAVPFDVTDRSAVLTAVESLGDVDVLVNNAGVTEAFNPRPFVESTLEDWHAHIDLNLFGSMYLMHALLPGMVARGWGRVVQISSGAGSAVLDIGVSLYAASKAGIEGLIRHVAREVGPAGVTVNALALGMMEPIARPSGTDASTARLFAGIPVGRPGSPADVGGAVRWLVSDAGDWVTGQVIHLNGGSFNGR